MFLHIILFFSDSSRMFCIGDVKPEVKKLVDVTKECVELGLEQVKPWGFLGDMGQAVHDHAYANGYTVVREIGGHGVGLEFHEAISSRCGQKLWRFTEAAGSSWLSALPCSGISKNTSGILCRRTPKPG